MKTNEPSVCPTCESVKRFQRGIKRVLHDKGDEFAPEICSDSWHEEPSAPVGGEPDIKQWVENLRESCHGTYNGGHHDEIPHDAFHHGMDTVCNVLVGGALERLLVRSGAASSPHHPVCNYQNGPIGGPGCICVVTYKKHLHELEKAASSPGPDSLRRFTFDTDENQRSIIEEDKEGQYVLYEDVLKLSSPQLDQLEEADVGDILEVLKQHIKSSSPRQGDAPELPQAANCPKCNADVKHSGPNQFVAMSTLNGRILWRHLGGVNSKCGHEWAESPAQAAASSISPSEAQPPKVYKYDEAHPELCEECDSPCWVTCGGYNVHCLHCWYVYQIENLSTLSQTPPSETADNMCSGDQDCKHDCMKDEQVLAALRVMHSETAQDNSMAQRCADAYLKEFEEAGPRQLYLAGWEAALRSSGMGTPSIELIQKLRKIEPITACPTCKSQTAFDAETDCTGNDDCPMTCQDDWNAALAELNREHIFAEIQCGDLTSGMAQEPTKEKL